jgi:hypothetical protein
MFISKSQLSEKPYDLCIIGAGIAGIIVAIEYSRRLPHSHVLVLECGGSPNGRNPLDDSIRNQNPRNHHNPYQCTNKGLGGSSLTWGGRCVMYDEIDFIPHGAVNEQCTWSLRFLDDIRPYLDTAGKYFDCGKAAFRLAEFSPRESVPLAENFSAGEVTDDCVERWSLPVRFGKQYQKSLRDSSAISLLRGFVVTRFGEFDSAQTVSRVELLSIDGTESLSVSAKTFVISAGGQESTRLLLNSPHLFKSLGSTPKSLGKFYQGHVSGKIAHVKFYGNPDKTQYGFVRDSEGIYCRRRFQFTRDAILRHSILNTAFWLDNPVISDASHKNGILSLIYLILRIPLFRKRLLPPAIAHALMTCKTSSLWKHVTNVVRDLPMSVISPLVIFTQRYCFRRQSPGVFLKSAENKYALHFHAEQTPRSANRMELSDDGLTMRIHYSYCCEDLQSVMDAHRILDQQLRRQQCGELVYLYPETDLPAAIQNQSIDGLHQVGTTRIADDAENGVVGSDLRVFGTSNVFVCSSSVFPTSGQANPTFFLGACAVRLADLIARERESTETSVGRQE